MRENMKSRLKKTGIIALFFVGLSLLIYPFISELYYRVETSNELVIFREKSNELNQEDIIRRIELAHAYNRTLDPSKLSDPFTKEEEEGRKEYARMLELEEKIGYVDIPKISQKIMVYAGTSDSVLNSAAGHLEGTSLPVGGINTHTVITAHRGLPRAKLFRDLDKMEIGDIFYINNIEGVLAYQVDDIQIVGPSDFEPILVKEGYDYATLLTCTPYMVNSHRLLIRGIRTEFKPSDLDKASPIINSGFDYKDYLALTGLISIILILLVFKTRHKALKLEKMIKEEKDKSDI